MGEINFGCLRGEASCGALLSLQRGKIFKMR